MMNRITVLFLAICVLTMVPSCKKQKAPDFHFEYFGLETGRYVIYDVMEITHDKDLSIEHDTIRYQLKTLWTGEYIDNEGRVTSEFRRFKRNTPSDPWALSDIWTGLYDGIRGELIEENQRTVKLVFAPSLNKQWDANAYNTQGELDCYYRRIHKDTIVNNIGFDSTVTVEQDDFTSLIDTVRKYEVYGKYVGLLYKHSKENHYNFSDPEPQKGTEVYYIYVSHGYE